MYVNESGAHVKPVGALDFTPEATERHRDMLMLQHYIRGISLRKIGEIMNVDHKTVGSRLKRIPPHVRKRCTRLPLGSLD